jgi:hypothetical protein
MAQTIFSFFPHIEKKFFLRLRDNAREKRRDVDMQSSFKRTYVTARLDTSLAQMDKFNKQLKL